MFIGSYNNSIDAKSRVIIPSKYREELGFKCVVTKGIDACLYVYTMEEWNLFAQKLKALPKADAKARNFVRHFYGNAEECEIDKQGRITIPSPLREYGNIEKELTTIGNGDKIEIWSRKQYEVEIGDAQFTGEEIAKGMEEYGI